MKPGRAARRSASSVDVGSELGSAAGAREDLDAAGPVRAIDEHLAVEAAGAQQRRIEDLGAVGRGEQHDAAEPDRSRRARRAAGSASAPSRRGRRSPDAAPRARPSASSSSMKMMHGALPARLLEQIAHARRADADEHLDELRAADREERHAGLAGDRAREQRLAGAGRARRAARPCGMRAPSRPYAFGSFRNATTSWSSALASSTPATSAKVTFVSVST